MMYRKVSFLLILLAMVGLFTGCVQIEITNTGALEYKEYDEKVFDKATQFNLNNANGSVVIEPSTDGKIKVQSMKVLTGSSEDRLREIATYVTIGMGKSGSSFNVETHYPMPRPSGIASMRVDYRIYLPTNTKVKVKTTNGSIQVNGIQTTLELQSSNGFIHVTNHRGFLDGRTTNGWIEVTGSEGEANLESSNGRISVRNYMGAIEAQTNNGRIDIDTTKVIHRASLETSNASILFKARLSRNGNYEFISSNGSIEAWIEKNLSYDLYAKTSNGRVQFTFPVQFSGTFEKNFVDGELFNGDNVSLRAKTSNGNITFMAWEDK